MTFRPVWSILGGIRPVWSILGGIRPVWAVFDYFSQYGQYLTTLASLGGILGLKSGTFTSLLSNQEDSRHGRSMAILVSLG